MKLFRSLVVLFSVFMLFFAQVHAATADGVKQAIIKHSIAMGVEPAIMLSIAKTESGFRQEARGASGTIGVFQLMPATAKNMGYNPYNLEENIKAGITYYKSMYKTFGSMELAIAAYNSGPVAVKRCNGIPKHSQGFVNKILADSRSFTSQTI